MKQKIICCAVLVGYVFIFFYVSPVFAVIKVANDPTRLGVGARPLGMGKSFVAVTSDPSVMFINPAGISTTSKWQITSMSGNFINEVSYSQFGGIYPTDFGNFGIGYIGSGIGFTAPVAATAEVAGEVRVIPSTTEGNVSYTYGNTAVLLSYGLALSRIFPDSFLENVLTGANLKLFSQNLAGGTIAGGSGSGYDMDLGMAYVPNNVFSLGANLQNILPASLGGKLVWPATGTRSVAVTESFPANLKVGLACKLMGKNLLINSNSQKLTWVMDIDRSLTLSSMPTLLHVGFEWWPTYLAALRFGVDQDIVGSSGGTTDVSNNITAGVGLLLGDFRFDYAYHAYNSVSNNDTHYFSICYGVGTTKLPPADNFVIKTPSPGKIVYKKTVVIKGRVIDKKIAKIKINGQVVPIDNQQNFLATRPTKIGKNIYEIIAYASNGKPLSEKKILVVRLVTYRDLAEKYWAKLPIEYLATLGVIAGYPDGTFRPNGNINRAELATLLVKSVGKKQTLKSDRLFSDVEAEHWANKYIQTAVKAGYVKGYPDKTYKPAKKINRVEGIVVIARYAGLKEVKNLIEPPFPDLPGRHWAAKMIAAAKQGGLLKYLSGHGLSPTRDMTRGEAAEIISKTPLIKAKITKLTSLEAR